MNIIDIIDDPRFFKSLFRDERSWRAWRVFLKALFGIPIMDETERELFRSCTGLNELKDGPSREAYVIAAYSDDSGHPFRTKAAAHRSGATLGNFYVPEWPE